MNEALLDANIVRLEQALEHEIAVTQNLDFRQAVRGSSNVTINQVGVQGVSKGFLALVLNMAYELWRKDLEHGVDDTLNLKAIERRTIIAALEQVGWRQDRAAPLLGISRRAAGYLIGLHGITHPRWRRNRPKELVEAT